MQSNIKIDRASFAFNQVELIKLKEEEKKNKQKNKQGEKENDVQSDNNPKQLVALIYQHGLLAALNKMKDKNNQVFIACINWMNKYNKDQKLFLDGQTPFIFEPENTIPRILKLENRHYRLLTLEVVDYLNWICRYY